MRKGGESEKRGSGGSKQISVLPGRPPAKVSLGLEEGMKEGGATGWRWWCGGGWGPGGG